MFTIDPFDINKNNEELCLICHDNLSSEPCHTLECKHKYHVDCIISWFRSGNVNCPYCNSKPENLPNFDSNYYYRSDLKREFSIVKKFYKSKDFPKALRSKVEIILKNEDKLKELKNELKQLKNEVGTYSDIIKKYRKTNSKIWKKTSDIYKKKKNLLSMINIVPLTIIKPIKKNVEYT